MIIQKRETDAAVVVVVGKSLMWLSKYLMHFMTLHRECVFVCGAFREIFQMEINQPLEQGHWQGPLHCTRL